MGLTSALFAGLTGMKTNEYRMDVIGNNIANVNTYGYKSSRADFQSQFSTTFSFGSAPNGDFGGTNPMQVGAGSTVGGTRRNFGGGAPETTGMKTDLAVQGQGMFVLTRPDGSRVYTRDGGFQLNAENYLLSADGFFLQGYGVDNDFNVVEGTLSRLRIPLGEVTTASPTSEAAFSGNINAEGNAADARGILRSQQLYDGAAAATAGTLLTAVSSAAAGPALFETGNVITLSAASKGGANLPEEMFDVTATNTLGEYIAWLEDVLGINQSTDLPDWTGSDIPDPGIIINDGTALDGTPDATLDGRIQVVGNMGVHNQITLSATAIQVSQGTAAAAPASSSPFAFTGVTGATATGESIRTSFRGYDSLGIPVDIDITLVMTQKDGAGITWRYFAESSDNVTATGPVRAFGTGTIRFDTEGNYLEGDELSATVERSGTGAISPQSVTFDFSSLNCFKLVSAVSLLSQDGFQAGTLADFSIASDGVITGSFTNGLNRNLGQVVLATFRNYEGLVAQDNNTFITGPNSGDAIVKQPLALGAGSITSSALELSNVDLSREFVNLIVSSTGFSASSRIIQTSDRLLSELMMMTR